jgi:hypothetical protein
MMLPYIIVGAVFLIGVVSGIVTQRQRVQHLRMRIADVESGREMLYAELERTEKERDQAIEDYMITQMQLEDAKSALRISDGYRLSLMISMAKRNNAILS